MCEDCQRSSAAGPGGLSATRRGFLLLGFGFVAGCVRQTVVAPMPAPPWPGSTEAGDTEAFVAPPVASPEPALKAVRPRSSWAQGGSLPSLMNPMLPVRHITIHHDGMDPFFGTDARDVAAHLETIRLLHRRRGWGDIGYHFAIDRAGRVWEGRPLRWQGAHVKDHNAGNIGIVCLGNFDEQMPTVAQLNSVEKYLSRLMDVYGVSASRVHTHQEWQGAATACPGTRLQEYLTALRKSGRLG